MGLLDLIFVKSKKVEFSPDFSKSEYDNWLDFLAAGGTTEEWERIKWENEFKAREAATRQHERFEREFRPIWNKYYDSLTLIKYAWSAMYNRKNYEGRRAQKFEQICKENIEYFKIMRLVENKYGKDHLTAVEGYTRLAMLYEKQGEFEKAAAVCKEACLFGIDESQRMLRMIKKAGRQPTAEELELMKDKDN